MNVSSTVLQFTLASLLVQLLRSISIIINTGRTYHSTAHPSQALPERTEELERVSWP